MQGSALKFLHDSLHEENNRANLCIFWQKWVLARYIKLQLRHWQFLHLKEICPFFKFILSRFLNVLKGNHPLHNKIGVQGFRILKRGFQRWNSCRLLLKVDFFFIFSLHSFMLKIHQTFYNVKQDIQNMLQTYLKLKLSCI